MSGIRKIAASTLMVLVSEFAVRLMSFVKLLESGTTQCEESDFRMMLESGHSLMVTFRKDLLRIARLQAKLSQDALELDETGLKKLSYSFEDFKVNLESVDLNDQESAWSFFDSGLDVFLKELEELATVQDFVIWHLLAQQFLPGKWETLSWRRGAQGERVRLASI